MSWHPRTPLIIKVTLKVDLDSYQVCMEIGLFCAEIMDCCPAPVHHVLRLLLDQTDALLLAKL
jgi:hypothetical protein